MNRIESIVVGVDFSACSSSALSQAVRLAGFGRARVTAVHVVDVLYFTDAALGVTPFLPDMSQTMIEDAKREWPRFRDACGGGAGIGLEVALGRPGPEVLRVCGRERAGLLVMGTCGEVPHRGVGTTAGACVRHAPCPVLLAAEGKAGAFHRITVGIDFSEQSREALELAMRVAAQDGSEVHAVHVFRAPWAGRRAKGSVLAKDPAAQAQYRELLRESLGAFCGKKAEVAWTHPRLEVVEHTSAGVGLAEYVARSGSDLVVLGTRGRTNLRDVLLGSTAERLVNLAPCSVLTVPPGA